jgi:hypothetical protein
MSTIKVPLSYQEMVDVYEALIFLANDRAHDAELIYLSDEEREEYLSAAKRYRRTARFISAKTETINRQRWEAHVGIAAAWGEEAVNFLSEGEHVRSWSIDWSKDDAAKYAAKNAWRHALHVERCYPAVDGGCEVPAWAT